MLLAYRIMRFGGGLGFMNLEPSIATLGRTSVRDVIERPSSQVTLQRNGIFTPEISR